MGSFALYLLFILVTGFVAIAAFSCLYHVGLAIVAPFCRHTHTRGDCPQSHSFAIVIPAHDEETTIAVALESCAALDYPKDKVSVYVVADNCSDGTAEVAVDYGAICLVRHDDERRGKGFALEWALPQVLAAGNDAIIVLDADCQIDFHALTTFDRYLCDGARALQANYVVGNPDASVTTYLLAIANALENDCFYAPKSLLGLAVMLRGTGMVFHRDILLQFPWHVRSVVEDSEYSLQLLENGIRIWFVPEVRIVSDFPARHDQLAVQRGRWIGGGLQIVTKHAPRLILEGLRSKRLVLLDAAVTMIVASRPLIIAQLLCSLLLSLLCWWILPGQWAVALAATCMAALACYTLYAVVGIAMLGIRLRRLGFLVWLPVAIAHYLIVAIKSLLTRKDVGWERTPRIEQSRRT